jgi:hypothetical protein
VSSSPERLRAARVAEKHLAGALPRRWMHVQAVAGKAHRLTPLVGEDGDVLVAAAWLHDIGYAPGITDTGFHALDGARWLLGEGFSPRVAALVAHHSCASYEADERGLLEALTAEFRYEQSPTSDALWFADMTYWPGWSGSVGERQTCGDPATVRRRPSCYALLAESRANADGINTSN